MHSGNEANVFCPLSCADATISSAIAAIIDPATLKIPDFFNMCNLHRNNLIFK